MLILAALTPKPGLHGAEFRDMWEKHADGVRNLAMAYQRNAVIQLPREQIRAIFGGTQFPAEKCYNRGGYEEFVFASLEDAQSFCNEHGDALRLSYGEFCDMQRSWYAGFDYVEHWGRADIGLKQLVVGTVLGFILGAKTNLGL